MPKYVVLYHAPASFSQQMGQATPEQAKAEMDAWMTWAQRVGPALVDLGTPLANAKRVTRAAAASATSTVGGYSILQADNEQAVLGLLKDHPHLMADAGCEIEVHEAMSIPGM